MSERPTCVGCKERKPTDKKGLFWCQKHEVGIGLNNPRCRDFTPPIEGYFHG